MYIPAPSTTTTAAAIAASNNGLLAAARLIRVYLRRRTPTTLQRPSRGLGDRGRLLHVRRDAGRGVRRGCIERLRLQQRVGEAVELLAVVGEQVCDLLVGGLDHPMHLFVEQALCGLRGGACTWQQGPFALGG